LLLARAHFLMDPDYLALESKLRKINDELDQKKERIFQEADRVFHTFESKNLPNEAGRINSPRKILTPIPSVSNNQRATPAVLRSKSQPQPAIKNQNSAQTETMHPANVAKVKLLEEEIQNLKEELRISHEHLVLKSERDKELDLRFKELTEYNNKLQHANADLRTHLEKITKQSEEGNIKSEFLQQQFQTAQKDLENLTKEIKHMEKERSVRDTRLNHVLEELEKYKKAFKDQATNCADSELNTAHRKEILNLQHANKRLEIQKTELLAIFKKQLKLIDILKRQKLHLEAVTKLSFIEEEFNKTLATV